MPCINNRRDDEMDKNQLNQRRSNNLNTTVMIISVIIAIVLLLLLPAGIFGLYRLGRSLPPEPPERLEPWEANFADRSPQWSYDGDTIVINVGNRLDAVNLSDGTSLSITGKEGKEQYSASLSSSGQLAYQSSSYDGASGRYERHIAVADVGDGFFKVLKQDEQKDPLYPVWSPDGSRFAYIVEAAVSNEDDSPPSRQMVVINYDDFSERHFDIQLFTRSRTDFIADAEVSDKVVWSNDGGRIAFSGMEFVGGDLDYRLAKYRISTIGVDGLNERIVVETVSQWPDARPSLPAWSLLDDRLYFVKRGRAQGIWFSELYSIKNDGTGQRLIVELDDIEVRQLKLSPDGMKLLLDGSYVVGLDGTGPKRLMEDYGQPTYGSWSPDGSRIAIYTEYDRVLSTVARDGSDIQRVWPRVSTQSDSG